MAPLIPPITRWPLFDLACIVLRYVLHHILCIFSTLPVLSYVVELLSVQSPQGLLVVDMGGHYSSFWPSLVLLISMIIDRLDKERRNKSGRKGLFIHMGASFLSLSEDRTMAWKAQAWALLTFGGLCRLEQYKTGFAARPVHNAPSRGITLPQAFISDRPRPCLGRTERENVLCPHINAGFRLTTNLQEQF